MPSKPKGNQVAPVTQPLQQQQQQPQAPPHALKTGKDANTLPPPPPLQPFEQQQQQLPSPLRPHTPPRQVKEAEPYVLPPLRRANSPQSLENRKTFNKSNLLYNSEPSWRSEKAAREARGSQTPPLQQKQPRDRRQPIDKNQQQQAARQQKSARQVSNKAPHHLAPPPSGHPKQAWPTPRGGQPGQVQGQPSARRGQEHSAEQSEVQSLVPKAPKGILKNKVNPQQVEQPRPAAAAAKVHQLSNLPPSVGVLVDAPVRQYNDQQPELANVTVYETIAGSFVIPKVRPAALLTPDLNLEPVAEVHHDFGRTESVDEFGAPLQPFAQSPTPSQQTLAVWAPTPLPPGTRLFSPPMEPTSVLGHSQQWQDAVPTNIISSTGEAHELNTQNLNEPTRMPGQAQQWEEAFPTSILPATVGIFQDDDLQLIPGDIEEAAGETSVTPAPPPPPRLAVPVAPSVASTALAPYYVPSEQLPEEPQSPFLDASPLQGQYSDEVSNWRSARKPLTPPSQYQSQGQGQNQGQGHNDNVVRVAVRFKGEKQSFGVQQPVYVG